MLIHDVFAAVTHVCGGEGDGVGLEDGDGALLVRAGVEGVLREAESLCGYHTHPWRRGRPLLSDDENDWK